MNLNSQQQMDEVKNAGQQATTLPDGKTIFDVLTPEQLDALNYRFKETFEVDLTDSTMKSSWNYQPFEHFDECHAAGPYPLRIWCWPPDR